MSDFTTDVVAGMTSLEQASALHSGFVFVLCGLLGVYGFEQARQAHAYQSERQGKILDEFKETGDYAQALKRFEVTVSQAIHDTSAPHGVICACAGLSPSTSGLAPALPPTPLASPEVDGLTPPSAAL